MVQRSLSFAIFGAWLCCPSAVSAVVTVHLVPHTHDDVGWLKTVDEYYTGKNNSIQTAYVKMILSTVVRCLKENPERKFTYVEQAFFQRWWRQQDEEIRNLTKQLVSSGQLEMANGGWCMHDEAAPHYMDMIDQTTLGHKLLWDEFGVFPKTGWQLDPFGHSGTNAALLSAEVGFDGLFFGRIDYQDLEVRKETRTPEFVWRGSESLGPQAQVFSSLTGEYGGNYGPPAGFNWNVDQPDEPMQTDPKLEDYNVKTKVDEFVALAMTQANQSRGTNILWTMGSDFQYEDALTWFYNLDQIIKYVNLDGRVHAQYSTPSLYIAAKAKETTITWPLKQYDFFPYADGPHQFWTGYFTSRPALKRYIRETGAFLRIVQQMAFLGGQNSPSDFETVQILSEAQGVAQHHDAVSGTAKQHVTFDYAKRLANGRATVLPVVAASLSKLSGSATDVVVCDLRNVSVCAPTQRVGIGSGGARACFALWNGLAQSRHEVVELPVGGPNVRIVTQSGEELPSQLVPSMPSVSNYGAPLKGAEQTLIFTPTLPPVGYQSFCLEDAKEPAPKAEESHEQVLENDYLKIEFCENRMCKITDKEAGITINANQNWFWYNSSVGNNVSSQKSGAYIFRPNRSEALPVDKGVPTLRLVKGPVADEVFQTFGSWINQRVRLARDARHIEITFTVGAIDVMTDHWGKEIVSRITTDLQTAGSCYTDSNGREMLQRQRDFRHSWKFNQTEPVAGNYFPIVAAAFIRDKNAQLTVLTDASQAGSGCVRDGEIELMVHRRLLEDDGRGVGEPLNETEYITPYVGPQDNQGQHYGPGLVIRGTHLLSVGKPAEAAKAWRPLVDRLHMPPQPFFENAKAAEAMPLKGGFSAVRPLPVNVQLVSLSWWNESAVLVRLAHQFGIGEDAELSKAVDVDLGSLFIGRRVEKVDERGLAGTISRADVLKKRIPWRVEGDKQVPTVQEEASTGSMITLGPLQIRTFFLNFASGGDKASDIQV